MWAVPGLRLAVTSSSFRCGHDIRAELQACLRVDSGRPLDVVDEVASMPSPFRSEFSTAHIRPLAVVMPSTSEEIADILEFASRCSIPVAVRSHTGHSYIGASTVENGLVILMSKFDRVAVTRRRAVLDEEASAFTQSNSQSVSQSINQSISLAPRVCLHSEEYI
eukprot:gnl/TRDRNA2_/TRDRNA2_124802_c0_seq1.p1 gnl/TRDRNA2_/TRDRNA2_124802_c0~~gnl/TRDRNA2_/TRDRNA2_124802_c0_seq1.p1  ORF type:complete len:165 (-),score=6.73 gnl/TRDRNA2_/TRDRNA2_124802_c0_seq1:139-633(-)